VPNTLAVIATQPSVKCAVRLYGFMFDQNGAMPVARASETFRFVYSQYARYLPKIAPVLIERASNDEMTGSNGSIESFVSEGLKHNAPITCLTCHDAYHGHYVVDESTGALQAIWSILTLFENNLDR